jgi:hypothetical protein
MVILLEEGCGSMERCESRGADNGFGYIYIPQVHLLEEVDL